MSPKTSPRVAFSITSKVDDVTKEMEARLDRAFNSIGVHWQAEAKRSIRHQGAVDTGRLMNSITFATRTRRPVFSLHEETDLHTKAPGAYTPVASPLRNLQPGLFPGVATPATPDHYVTVGTNVEYAAPVHEGIRAQVSTVRRHWVRPFTRKSGVAVAGHWRGPYSRNTPYRPPTKFIEGPGRRMLPQYKREIERAVRGDP